MFKIQSQSIHINRGRKGGGGKEGLKPPNFKIRGLSPPGLHSRLCTQSPLSFNVQELTTVRTICYMIYETSIDKMMFFEVYSRTYFFNLTPTKKCYIHIRTVLITNLLEIAKEFVSFNDRWINFLGHFWRLII